MNQQLKTQVFNFCFSVTSPIAVPSLGLQDLIVPGVSGPAEGQGFWKALFFFAFEAVCGCSLLVHFFLKWEMLFI